MKVPLVEFAQADSAHIYVSGRISQWVAHVQQLKGRRYVGEIGRKYHAKSCRWICLGLRNVGANITHLHLQWQQIRSTFLLDFEVGEVLADGSYMSLLQ